MSASVEVCRKSLTIKRAAVVMHLDDERAHQAIKAALFTQADKKTYGSFGLQQKLHQSSLIQLKYHSRYNPDAQ